MKVRLISCAGLAILLATAGGAASPEWVPPDHPLTLDDCTAIALARNPQITASHQQVVAAQAGLTSARSSYYPQLALSAVEGFTGADSSGELGASGSDTREQLDLGLSMTFWRQGRSESVKQSEASLRAAQHSDASTAQGLVEQVAVNYYGALAAGQLLQVAEAGVESAQGHLELVKAFIAAGEAAEVDIYPAEDDLAQAQLDVIDARGSLQLALAQLKNTMGLPPESSLALAGAPPADERPTPSLQEAIQTAQATRVDVAATEASVTASQYALAQARIERGPVAQVSGAYSSALTQWRDSSSSWDLLFGVSWPLFDGHAAQAGETAARASLERSRADLQSVVNQVGLEVESALVEVERASERVGASAKSVAAAEALQAAAEGKYQQGLGILLEVVDARDGLTSARANQVRARYDHQIALVALQKALGTLAIPGAGEYGNAHD